MKVWIREEAVLGAGIRSWGSGGLWDEGPAAENVRDGF